MGLVRRRCEIVWIDCQIPVQSQNRVEKSNFNHFVQKHESTTSALSCLSMNTPFRGIRTS